MHNGSRAAGIGVYCWDPVPLRISEPIFSTSNTNNEAEWIALAVSVAWVVEAKNADTLVDCNEITFCVDSQYIFNAMTKWIEVWRQNNWRSSKKTAVAHLGNAQVSADHKEIVTRVMDSANALSRSG
ncbi:hypothetical protein PCANC_01379 [Puccinia coronata f. sp. avenae]|uniref:RNase H type-1 domain-containing protein n=1 Tax=Puccinia coronata f. sp. avenae TaxID=200324 RepID=A0A2N5W637_9BASI|nr:hypothetical protein PCANC_01379 [Puccinia coronata f. sp. avenae]